MNTKEMAKKTNETLLESEYYSILNGKDGRICRIHLQTRKMEYDMSIRMLTATLGHPNGRNSAWALLPAKMEYRPDILKVRYFSESEQMIMLNKYIPPKFREAAFWKLEGTEEIENTDKRIKTLEDLKDMPKCYVDYFKHLCNYDDASIQYVLDWLAVAVSRGKRNLTTLVLISTEGSGKGVFYDRILVNLFGERNTVHVKGKDALDSRFNSQFKDKQIVFLDEVEIKTSAAINRFKAFANPTLEIEQKGVDPTNEKNWANTLITSNDLDSISVGNGNRRYSIIHTTDIRLDALADEKGYGSVESLIEELEAESNIAELYQWLSGHMPNRNMNYAFESVKKTSEIKEASLAEWEILSLEILSEEYRKTDKITHITLKEVQERLQLKGVSKTPGRKVVDRFVKKFPKLFTMKWDSKANKLFIEIKGTYQPQIDVEHGTYGSI